MQDGMHEVLGSNLDIMHNFHFSFFRVHTGMYQYVPGLSQYILICTRQTWYILVCTRFVSVHTVQGFVTVCTRFVTVHTGMYQVCLSTYCSGTLPFF